MMLACGGPEPSEVDTRPTGPNYALIFGTSKTSLLGEVMLPIPPLTWAYR